MILIFFISLAFLTWLICRELERGTAQRQGPSASCGGCGQDFEDDWLICPRCGALTQEHCPSCGERHACDDAYCPWCGSATAERAA